MPITTYRSDKSTFVTDDKDINEFLPKNYYVERIEVKKLFKKPYFLYQLLYDLDWEYQIINFWGENGTLNTFIRKEVLIAYLLGIFSTKKEEK